MKFSVTVDRDEHGRNRGLSPVYAMASADFCPITLDVAARSAAPGQSHQTSLIFEKADMRLFLDHFAELNTGLNTLRLAVAFLLKGKKFMGRIAMKQKSGSSG